MFKPKLNNSGVDKKREYVRCAICDSDEYRIVFMNSSDKFMKRLSISGKSRLVMCNNCSLVYHNPRIKEGLMRQLYLTYEYPTRNENVQRARQRDAKERFEWLRAIHGEVENILEIGCAEGFILSLFKSIGKNVKGIDPSDKYAQLGRDKGVLIETGFFDKKYVQEGFDLIISCNTFEHMYHPVDILSQIRKCTRKYLFFECPNVFKPRDNLKHSYFNTTHVYMYSLNTMRRILALTGFEAVKMDDSGFGIRVLARKTDRFERIPSKDNYWELRKRILSHQIGWCVNAEWKDQLRRWLKW